MAAVGLSDLKKTWYYLQKNGIREAWNAVRERLYERRQTPYLFMPPEESILKRQRQTAVSDLRISVVMPAYETDPGYLAEAIRSLMGQTYPHWELVLADAGQSLGVYETAAATAREGALPFLVKDEREDLWQDRQIRYLKLDKNEGIAGNTNAGIGHALGDYVGLMDHDDLLTPDALYETAAAVETGKKAGEQPFVLYSDEDKCDGSARRFYEPHFKGGLNLDLLLSNNYVCHFLVMERGLMRELMLRPAYEGAQDYDLVLRAAARQAAFCHIGKVLYHWRCHDASTAQNPKSKAYAYEAGRRAVEAFCRDAGWNATVSHLKHLGFYRVDYTDGVFSSRSDVGALAGPLPGRRELKSGIYESDGSMRFAGLKKGFSGPMHRAALQQDVECADLRCLTVRKELMPLYQQAVQEMGGSEASIRSASIRFCQKLRREGYRILWDPQKGTA